jgi:hypothetical protein
LNRPSAIEIFLTSGRTFFIDFPQQNSFDILRRLQKLLPESVMVQITPFSTFFATTTFTQDWLKSRISNFTYLCLLNLFSGRSFHDVSQYPLFPWILADYSSEKLNVRDRTSYRDLEKWITTLNEAHSEHDRGESLLDHYVMNSNVVRRYLRPFHQFPTLPPDIPASIEEAFRSATESPSDYSELIPEFFFMPEIFDNAVALPPWANGSPLAFVYFHRKALESSCVTEALHHWIDLIWGCKQRDAEAAFPANLYETHTCESDEASCASGYVPHQLFTSPHPHRVSHSWKRAPLDHTIVCQLPALSILFGSIRSDELFLYEVQYVESGGDIVRMDVNMMNVENPRTLAPRRASVDVVDDGILFRWRVAIPQFSDFARPFHASFFTAFGSTIAIIDGRRSSVALVDTGTGVRSDLLFHNSSVICVSEQNGWLVTAGRDAVVNVFAIENVKEPLFSIPLYGDEITCCTVSAGFGLIASGTRDGFLVLSSLERGSNVHVVDLGGCRPYAVTITEAWGFVVVCATRLEDGNLEHSMSVYSTNGAFIRKEVMQDAMVAWTSWSSATGFDYVMVASEQGRLFYCEAFFLDFTYLKGAKLSSQVVGLRYHPKELGLLVICANAELHLVPLVTDS